MNVPQANAPVQAFVMVDDFFLAGSANTTTDANGNATVTFDAAAAAMGSGSRYIHVTSGPTWPFVERILALP